MNQRLLIATHNPGKVREYRTLLADLPLELTYLDEAGITEEVDETGITFEENAVLKAQAYHRLTGLWTWADDSGLAVDALGGAPGVLSARYAGPNTNDADRYRKLLDALTGIAWNRRTARFCCVVALAMPHQQTWTATGVCEGTIAFGPAGTNGFGYDPVFYLPAYDATMAQLSPDEKNRISHRGRAAASARQYLASLFAERHDDQIGSRSLHVQE